VVKAGPQSSAEVSDNPTFQARRNAETAVQSWNGWFLGLCGGDSLSIDRSSSS
jgi:hypothetical protein